MIEMPHPHYDRTRTELCCCEVTLEHLNARTELENANANTKKGAESLAE
ncbi:MAG: hypothetical protein ACPHCI_05230 [Solirubrobacterales bacterium]